MKSEYDKRQLGLNLRDQGCQLVADNEDAIGCWRTDVINALRKFCARHAGEYFAMEDFKIWWLAGDGYGPHHVNAWGAIVRTAVRLRLMIPTPAYRKAVMPAAHARAVRLYVARNQEAGDA